VDVPPTTEAALNVLPHPVGSGDCGTCRVSRQEPITLLNAWNTTPWSGPLAGMCQFSTTRDQQSSGEVLMVARRRNAQFKRFRSGRLCIAHDPGGGSSSLRNTLIRRVERVEIA